MYISTIRRFKIWQKQHPNFVTPELLKLAMKDGKIIELSKGEGMFDKRKSLYGVSVLKPVNSGFKSIDHPLKGLFHNKSKAKKRFNKLKKVL